MKLRAIRMRETGGFQTGMALEGLVDGLNLLVKPNEFGKSTILRALRALFFERHASMALKGETALLRKLKPAQGGTPLIEADFEVDGRQWRLRKQFINGKMACLSDLDRGQVVARNSEADAMALQLLRGPVGAQFDPALLWIDQAQALKVQALNRNNEAGLYGLIERKIQDVASGQQAREIMTKIDQRLEELVTKTGKPKSSGDYGRAIKERDRIQAALEITQTKATEATERSKRLTSLIGLERKLRQPVAAQARKTAVVTATTSLQAARAAREQMNLAKLVVKNCEIGQETATKELAAFEHKIVEIAELEATLADICPALSELHDGIKDCEEHTTEALKERGEQRALLQQLQQQVQQAEAEERCAQAAARLAGLKAAFAGVEALEKDLALAADELCSYSVTAAAVANARSLSGEIDVLKAQLTASAPEVKVAYLPGVGKSIKIDGKAVADGSMYKSARPLVLEISGVGTITVEAGSSEDLVELQSDLAARQEQLISCHEMIGTKTLADAERQLNAKVALEQKIEQHKASLNAMIPAGIDSLKEQISSFTKQATVAVSTDLPPIPVIIANRAKQEEACSVSDGRYEELRLKLERFTADHKAMTAMQQMRSAAVAKLSLDLPPKAERQRVQTDLIESKSKAERNVNAARRDYADWLEKSGDDESFAALEEALQDALRTQNAADTRLSETQTDIKVINAALEASAQDGVELHLTELEERLGRAERSVRSSGREIEALRLLVELLAQGQAASSDKFMAPIFNSISPYLSLVIPQAKLEIAEGMTITGLARGKGEESLDLLSDGTQEQIAVLVRLGFGALLARFGAPIPLILDDAFVYSDDQRLQEIFKVLKMAADCHQMIVLTCHDARYNKLACHVMEKSTWNPLMTEF